MSHRQQYFYVDQGGRERGPISEADLVQRLRSGRLPDSTRVRVADHIRRPTVRALSIPYLRDKVKGGARPPVETPAQISRETATVPGPLDIDDPRPSVKPPARQRGVLERTALVIGYTTLVGGSITLLLWLGDDLLRVTVGLILALLAVPAGFIVSMIAFFVSLLLCAVVASALVLPLRPFLEGERWEGLVGGIGVVLWIVLSIALAVQ